MAVYDLYGKDLISTQEWSREELQFVIEFAKDIKDGNTQATFLSF
jgi:hypothetical protein